MYIGQKGGGIEQYGNTGIMNVYKKIRCLPITISVEKVQLLRVEKKPKICHKSNYTRKLRS